ncbi:MAG TPA: GDP-mannose 4,6-dehydratase [Polyangiaceae bacterium]|nr:GDP-mannose 4,6-dehydratase [Polyangiaceae bacterium]
MRRALITGVTGQDGSYLAELLLDKGYEVHGIVRRSSSFNTWRIDHIQRGPRFALHYADLTDLASLQDVIRRVVPDELYNLGAQSHVRVSFDMPEYTGQCTGLGCLRLLEILRGEKLNHVRFYQASSSELYGKVKQTPQTEETAFHPRSPYAAAKAYAYYVTQNYREAYGLFAVNGILFNHESPRRGENFVTRKITRAATRIKLGLQQKLALGNLDARRDWGFAQDYVDAMWRMMQATDPSDYVIATGETHSVREFLDESFGLVGLDWKDFVREDPRQVRPSEVDLLQGDASKARRELGWTPRTPFKTLVKQMVEHDLELAEREKSSGLTLRWL